MMSSSDNFTFVKTYEYPRRGGRMARRPFSRDRGLEGELLLMIQDPQIRAQFIEIHLVARMIYHKYFGNDPRPQSLMTEAHAQLAFAWEGDARLMATGCYAGWLGLDAAIDNGDTILNRLRNTRMSNMQAALFATHGAQYSLWWGHPNQRNHKQQYRAEATRLLADDRFSFRQRSTTRDKIGHMDLYCELLLMFEQPEVPDSEREALQRLHDTLECTDQFKLHLKLMVLFLMLHLRK